MVKLRKKREGIVDLKDMVTSLRAHISLAEAELRMEQNHAKALEARLAASEEVVEAAKEINNDYSIMTEIRCEGLRKLDKALSRRAEAIAKEPKSIPTAKARPLILRCGKMPGVGGKN